MRGLSRLEMPSFVPCEPSISRVVGEFFCFRLKFVQLLCTKLKSENCTKVSCPSGERKVLPVDLRIIFSFDPIGFDGIGRSEFIFSPDKTKLACARGARSFKGRWLLLLRAIGASEPGKSSREIHISRTAAQHRAVCFAPFTQFHTVEGEKS